MALSEQEKERYKKHIQLKQVGLAGQEKLKNSSVLVVGAGGLGSPVLLYLAGAGVGHIGIVDGDKVSLSNLQRQVLHTTRLLDAPKVESAWKRLGELNPEIVVNIHADRITQKNAAEMIRDYEIVVDCTDNLETRFLINETCVKQGIPMVYGAVFEYEGQVAVFDAKRGPCLRCMIPEIPPVGSVPDPEAHGLLNSVPGVIGMLQATEVLKLILGVGEPLIGKLLLYDSLTTTTQTIRLNKQADCPVCSIHTNE